MNADENKMLIGVYLRSSAAINDFFTASQGACLLPAVCLEGNLHGHLNVPRGAEGGDLAERRATRDAAPNGLPVAVVQDVEEVGAKLRVQPLSEFEIPAEGHIEIDLAGSIDGVASEIAEHAGSGASGVDA